MSVGLILALTWFLAANVGAMLPSRDYHWRFAYLLIACGVPILGLVTWSHGPWVGLLTLAAGMSMLRWPVIYLVRWVRGRVGQ